MSLRTNVISYLKHICLPFVGNRDGIIFVSHLSHLLGGQIWLHIWATFVSFPNVVKLIMSSSVGTIGLKPFVYNSLFW